LARVEDVRRGWNNLVCRSRAKILVDLPRRIRDALPRLTDRDMERIGAILNDALADLQPQPVADSTPASEESADV